MNQKDLNPIALALGITGALACSSAIAAENPFSLTELSSGQVYAGSHGEEGKCGEEAADAAEGEAAEGEAAEGEAAEGEAAEGEAAEGEAAEGEAAEEGKCGEGRCGEGKCGDDHQ